MGNIYPDQLRTIDPYSEYNSNVVNRLTRIVTTGRNCLRKLGALQVIQTGVLTVQISTGMCFKDDVIIELQNPFDVLFTDSDFYPEGYDTGIIDGYYFVLLDYIYEKAKPAPRAAVSILRPDQLTSYDSTSYLFLACVHITSAVIDVVLSASPALLLPIEGHREYAPFYVGVYETLTGLLAPAHEDEFIYVIDEARLYFSDGTNWIKMMKKYIFPDPPTSPYSGSTWNITHSLKDKFINITVFNSSWQQIQPTNITLVDLDNCTVTFNTTVSGYAVISA